MSLLSLPHPPYVPRNQDEPDRVLIDCRIASIALYATELQDDDVRTCYRNVAVTLSEPLDLEQFRLLPPHYRFDYGTNTLTREVVRGCLPPNSEHAWPSIEVTIDEGEDPTLYRPFVEDRDDDYWRSSFRLFMRRKNMTETEVGEYLTSIMFDGFYLPPLPVSRLLTEWSLFPVDATYMSYPGAAKRKLKSNGFGPFVRALFPDSLKPEIKSASGRAFMFEEAEHPVELDPSLFPVIDPGIPSDTLRMLTLGISDDFTSYCAFKVPAFLNEPQWANFSKAPGALPISRAMIFRSPKAFHFIFALRALTPQGQWSRPRPFLYCIPIVIPEAEVHAEPCLLPGVPRLIMAELCKAAGLTNAMKRAMNQLQGQLLKLKKLGLNLDCLYGLDLELCKPHQHVVCMMNSHSQARAPWRWAVSHEPVITGLIIQIGYDLRLVSKYQNMGPPWCHPLIIPRREEKLQPVAKSQRRALDL